MAAEIAEDATALIAWINNHGKVRKIFDEAQAIVSKDCNAGKIIILEALELSVLQKRAAIIDAEVVVATSTERERPKKDATRFCALIEDRTFWSGLETVLGDLEPICLVRLEKRWLDCDQPALLLALILNPFEMLSCFGPNAGLNYFKCGKLILYMCRRMKNRPDNPDTAEERAVKEREVSKAVLQYSSGTGEFSDWAADREEWEDIYDNADPILVWDSWKGTRELRELAEFAIVLLQIVANQAGCERTFSKVKVQQTDHRNRLKLDKIDQATKARLLFWLCHAILT
ncbi:hypothetical protein B0H10DRAFT_2246758 [Mycena sp. CBHHK59/15]|nr:hypothetical protein B0H10DRAFT_2246758 [Mycena sp. CBHHK59/15]